VRRETPSLPVNPVALVQSKMVIVLRVLAAVLRVLVPSVVVPQVVKPWHRGALHGKHLVKGFRKPSRPHWEGKEGRRGGNRGGTGVTGEGAGGRDVEEVEGGSGGLRS